MLYRPIEVANTFLHKFGKEQGGISHMKLQKLVYCAYGWWLAYNEKPFLKEAPEVWKYGPVFSSMYHELKVYGSMDMQEPIKPSPFDSTAPIIDPKNDKENQLIDWVWQRYGHLSGLELSEMTHKEGTAWSKIAEKHEYSVPKGFSIEASYVKDEFNAIKDAFAGSANER